MMKHLKKYLIQAGWATVVCVLAGRLQAETNELQVINYSEDPVFATAVGVPASRVGASTSGALKARDQHGRQIPLQLLGDQLYAYVSLKGSERLDLAFSSAESWEAPLTTASFKDGTGHIANGIVRLDYANHQWSLSFEGPLSSSLSAGNLELIRNCKSNLWLDHKNRGRLLGLEEKELRGMGLIPTRDARLVNGEAAVHPDGSVTLKLVHSFDGFAKNVKWTQTYTLLPGLPQVVMDINFTVSDDTTLYLAYVDLGGGLSASYGPLLQAKPLLKYVDPQNPEARIAGGASSGLIRVSWRGERCWLGLAGGNGSGLSVSTLQETRSLDRGATVWNVSGSDFLLTLLEDERKHFPFDISRGKPFHNGLTLLGTSGEIDVWQQTKALFKSQTGNKPLPLMSSYAVFLNGEPLQTGFVSKRFPGKELLVPTADGKSLQAAIKLSRDREYLLSAQSEKPATLNGRMFGSGKELELIAMSPISQQSISLSDPLKTWASGDRRQADFVLTVPAASGLKALSLQEAPMGAPELSTPRADQQVTDYAVFYRWKKVPRALEYELQWSSDSGFIKPNTRTLRMETDLVFYLPKDDELQDPGVWYWRVRAIDGETKGAWSEVRKMTVNNDHSKSPLKYPITPEQPLFTHEGCRVKRGDVGQFRENLPQEIRKHAAFVMTPLEEKSVAISEHLVEYFQPLAGSEVRFFTRPMNPGPMADDWGSLSEVEALFQENPNCMGSETGEVLSALYKGGQPELFAHRLIRLCAKYGKLFYIADGTYPLDNKWEDMYRLHRDFLVEHKSWLAFAQKNNILHRQMLSQSSTLGLYLSGMTVANGAWEDGGWYWQQTGFSTLGKMHGQRGGDVRAMPRIFWCLNFIMGISRGTTIFSLEGQTGTAPDMENISEIDKPLAGNPSAYWTRTGKLLPTYHQFVKPLLDAIVDHQLIPTKEQVLDNIKLAVYNDGIPATGSPDPYYRQFHSLFAGTYGFKPMDHHPGELYEFFPNTGRYHYFPVFPQGKVDLGSGIKTLPLSALMDEQRVRDTFNAAYPESYQGDALVGMVGDTLTVLNSNENADEPQSYSVPLNNRGKFSSIEGTVDVHSYLIGKFEDHNRNLWLQINSEYPERVMKLKIASKDEPKLKITPSQAVVSKQWKNGKLELELSHSHGAVELNIEP
jgi:hypothetical protein